MGSPKGLVKIVTTAPEMCCPVFSSVTLPLIMAHPVIGVGSRVKLIPTVNSPSFTCTG